MSVPVLVVTGFLGAGKTTFINQLLQRADGRRISAIVNDFGAINIDAELIADAADTVVGLKNGCICCSLQGDLLRTLKLVLSQPVQPDHVVIEASGVADPRGITETLMDPILWHDIRLDAVVAVVDADEVAANPARLRDELWRAQVEAADFIALSKTRENSDEALRAELVWLNKTLVFETDGDALPIEALLVIDRPQPVPGQAKVGASRFTSIEWQSSGPVALDRFQAAIDRLAPKLIRAKGIVSFVERPGQSFLLQLVGRRATLRPFPKFEPDCRLVLIAEASVLDAETAHAGLAEITAS
ncbi:CobW family GTP-binding protein [Aminobacter aminovorans]|uniref:Cobalamin biosynthesis protein CobW n=1 Tax=Aminobacter aminovorans TaxID=83263 RepID=A0AAC8YTM7_AMIAI|nr:CobW family GTP-binding protein [Aminobacter aminovorans]AMS43834.1 Cobalamin biosynthesis protein CobW [Aminobacter aminovorans]MBB3707340.1 G3E family GTPase [Aminobacter aminovorans]